MLQALLDACLLVLLGTLGGMMLADCIHEWKTGKRIRDCAERETGARKRG